MSLVSSVIAVAIDKRRKILIVLMNLYPKERYTILNVVFEQ